MLKDYVHDTVNLLPRWPHFEKQQIKDYNLNVPISFVSK